MKITANDLFLSTRLWIMTLNKASRRKTMEEACEERGLVVSKDILREGLLKMWREDGADEHMAVQACRRMAKRRGIDTSHIPDCIFPPRKCCPQPLGASE